MRPIRPKTRPTTTMFDTKYEPKHPQYNMRAKPPDIMGDPDTNVPPGAEQARSRTEPPVRTQQQSPSESRNAACTSPAELESARLTPYPK